MASDGQAVAKWLFTPHPDNVPKVFDCTFKKHGWDWPKKIAAFKAAFSNASSPANFIVINELTGERLALKRTDNSDRFLLIRCPIVRDQSKWEMEAIGWRMHEQWNRIGIQIYDEDEIGKGLRNAKLD
ncbi:hypothetical protein niasHT_017570 [Heterodera trifolii]|uniref:Uncharacterized protein n=1 Tax=Heterodera trifolii TaxID=157864 RepID=A0ABD2LA27_9BILA